MTFGIIEIKDSKKSIVGYTESVAEFRNQLEQRYPKAKLHQNLGLTDLKSNTIFKNDSYLINNDLDFFYIEKSTVTKSGYIYSSTKSAINVICQWELIPCNIVADVDDLELPQYEFNDLASLESTDDTYQLNDSYIGIKELNLNELPPYCKVNIVGKRGTGKTQIVSNILDRYDSEFIANTLIISPYDKMTGYYKTRFPTAKVIYEYDVNEIQQYLNKRDETGRCVPGGIILDDCLSSSGTYNTDNSFRELMFNGKHYRKLVVITMQFPLGLKPELRSQFDYVFLLSEDFYSNQKRLYDHYGGIFPTFDDFRNVLMELTTDYCSMVLYTSSISNHITDKVAWFKASVDN
jgi:hypothetical protein